MQHLHARVKPLRQPDDVAAASRQCCPWRERRQIGSHRAPKVGESRSGIARDPEQRDRSVVSGARPTGKAWNPRRVTGLTRATVCMSSGEEGASPSDDAAAIT